MKFKVTPKDFMLFVFYCAVLLYFCALVVSNFVCFSQEGHFYGLLPWSAFKLSNIGFTFGLFIAVLIFLFTTVSSFIFDRDKNSHGIGIHLSDKPSDGYSKWASEKEIKQDKGVEKVIPSEPEIKAAGIPLINKGKELWVDNGEYHNLVIGATGSGKTECIVKPLVNMLSKKGESMVITDPKGEIYEFCGEYLKSQGYKIVILNFRDPLHGNSWNPLTLPYLYYKENNKDKSIELVDDVALNILYDPSNKSDSDFWEKGAADYFSGLALGLFADAKEEEINLNSINYMSSAGEEKRGPKTYIQEYFLLKGEESSEYMFASTTINAPGDTKGGLLSTFRQKIRKFSTQENLSEMLSYSDFDMRKIGDEKTAVFMIIHDEKKTYHSLMSIFTKQCYETLINAAQKSEGGKLKYRTNFILDEFANMPPLKDVDSMVTAARSRAIRFTFIIQNFSQLNDVYGQEIAETIRGNCGNLIYLISTELKALEEISKMCGEVKSKEKDKTASTPLVTVTDLQKLNLFEAIIIRWRKSPLKTKLTPNFKMNWGINYGKASLPTRESKPVQLFDVKKFVSEKKKDETMNNPSGMFGSNPFAGGGFNPFIQPSPISSPSSTNIPQSPFATNPVSMPSNQIDDDEIDNMVKEIEKKLAALEEEENREKEKEIKGNQKETISEELPEKQTVTSNNIESDIKNITEINNVVEENVITDVDFMNDNHEDDIITPIIQTKPSKEEINNIISELDSNVAENNEKVDIIDMTQEIKPEDISKQYINVDKESVVVSNNVVTDDEYLDDFFDE